MGLKTPLFEQHVTAGAKIVDFGGWDMPIHYGSQLEEHHAVRSDVGMCDVSHMTVVDVSGAAATDWLRHLLCNDVARLDAPGQALYTAMLNEAGGILDDLIVYRQDEGYRLVVNCATREKDLAWMNAQAGNFDVVLTERADLAILAVQGPASQQHVEAVLPESGALSMDAFTACVVGDWFVARTGYTGESGFELIVPGDVVASLWDALLQRGVRPVGLGARDTLRLEAGMNLYGSDMDESVTPLESNIAFTVALDDDRNFIGSSALRAQKQDGIKRRLIGVVMETRGVLRAHYPVGSGDEVIGEFTSGAFSPTLGYSIGLARVESPVPASLWVEIRGKRVPIERVRPPFVRNGKKVYKPFNPQ